MVDNVDEKVLAYPDFLSGLAQGGSLLAVGLENGA
jgi:hypothetical protein